MTFSVDVTSHGNLRVGDRVIAPGHRKADPSTLGILTRIIEMHFARGLGYFAEITTDDGNVVTAAIGIIRKEA